MTSAPTSEQDVQREFDLVTYTDLTPEELRNSNYSDSKLSVLFMDGINGNTNYEYSVGFFIEHPHGPYLKIDT